MGRRVIIRVFLLNCVLLLGMTGCMSVPSWPTATPISTPVIRQFELEELLLDASMFPFQCNLDGLPQEFTYEMRPGDTEEGFYAQFDCLGLEVRVNHAIYRSKDAQTAVNGYDDLLSSWFYNADRITPYEIPDWLQYQSSVADQFQFACADFYGGYPAVHSKRCAAVGRYEEYISALSISMSDFSVLSDPAVSLEQILSTIDEQTMLYLAD